MTEDEEDALIARFEADPEVQAEIAKAYEQGKREIAEGRSLGPMTAAEFLERYSR